MSSNLKERANDLEKKLNETFQESMCTAQSGFKEKLDSIKNSKKFSGLSALIVDATDTEHWDIFKYFQKKALHLGAVSVASLLAEAGFDDVKAVYEVLTPHFNYSREKPSLIGVSAIIANLPFANRKIASFRKANPDTLIIAGGAGYHFDPDMAIKAGADAVVIGKAEYPVLELLETLVDNRIEGEGLKDVFNRVYVSGIRGVYTGEGEPMPADMVMRFDDVPVADFSLIQGETSKAIRTVMSSEGCTVQDCNFCSAKLLNNRKYRHNSADVVAAKLKTAQDDKVKHVFIADDHFLGRGYNNLVQITDAIMDAGLEIGWSSQMTIKSIYDRLNEGIVDRLVKSNCTCIYFGVESVYDDDIAEMDASKKTSNAMLKEVLSAMKGKIASHAMCVLKPFVRPGYEGISYSVEDTPSGRRDYMSKVRGMVDFLKKHGVRTAQFHSAVPLPGASMTSSYYDAGIVLKTAGKKLVDWSKFTGQYVVASANPIATHKIMIDAYKRFYSLKGMWGFIMSGQFRKAFMRGIGRTITNGYLLAPETRRYVNALEKGDFEFYKPGEFKYYVPPT